MAGHYFLLAFQSAGYASKQQMFMDQRSPTHEQPPPFARQLSESGMGAGPVQHHFPPAQFQAGGVGSGGMPQEMRKVSHLTNTCLALLGLLVYNWLDRF